MHEMSIAVNVVDIAVQTARQANAHKINHIVLELGTLSGVVRDALEFCFESACKGTLAEGAGLQIEDVPGEAHCPHCQKIFAAQQMVESCPSCAEMVMEIQGGRELKVKSINVD